MKAQYVESGRTFPTPLVQGKDRDREVLRTTQWPGRSQILLGKDEDGLKINAGAIQGLTKGTILAVYPPPGQARGDKPLGYVRIAQRQTLESRVDPCAYDGLDTDPDRLTPGGVCEPTVVDYGDLRLRVTVDRLDNRGRGIPADQHQSLTGIRPGLVPREGIAGEARGRTAAGRLAGALGSGQDFLDSRRRGERESGCRSAAAVRPRPGGPVARPLGQPAIDADCRACRTSSNWPHPRTRPCAATQGSKSAWRSEGYPAEATARGSRGRPMAGA